MRTTTSLVHRLLPFAVLGVVAVAVPAVAQTGDTPTAPLTVYPACVSQPTKDDSEVAHGAYIAGKRAFDENDYPTAIQYFRDAFRRDCNKYELLNIISRSYELKGDKPEAINALETYLKRAPANDPSTEAIQKRLTNLRAQAAADASAKVAASGSASATTTASAAPSASAAPTATATSAPPETRGHTIGPWIVVGAGIVVLAVGIPLTLVGQGQVNDPTKADRIRALGCDPNGNTCPGNNPSQRQAAADIANEGYPLRNTGIVVTSVGAAAVIGGLVWHFLEPTGPAPSSSSAKVDVKPDARPGFAGLSVGGTF